MELQVKEPLPEEMDFAKQFAKATGDFGFLSRNDLDLIALTVRLHKAAGGTLRDKPIALSAASEFQTAAFDWAPSRAAKEEVDESITGAKSAAAEAVTEAECADELSAKFADVSV